MGPLRDNSLERKKGNIGPVGCVILGKKRKDIMQVSEATLRIKQWSPGEAYEPGLRGLPSDWRSYRKTDLADDIMRVVVSEGWC